MHRAIWGLAAAADVVGMCTTWPLFALRPSLASVAWGLLVLALFAALLALLVRPRLFGARAILLAKFLCPAVPAVVSVRSLDAGALSGLEVYAIIVAIVVGWLNWVIIRRHGRAGGRES